MPNVPLMITMPYRLQVTAVAVCLAVSTMVGAGGRAIATTLKQTDDHRSETYKVLFVGNSHLFVNDVPARVERRLRPTKGPVMIQTFAFGGAQLSQFTRSSDVAAALMNTVWDVVVLQEASASFLTSTGRRRFHQSVSWFLNRIPTQTRVVLYQTWPWQTGSTFFDGQQTSADRMWRLMRAEYTKIASRSRITIAPVGHCWVNSPKRATYYSSDGVHATVAGSRVAAAVIAGTILRGAPGPC